MSNRLILETLLNDIHQYSKARQKRADFAIKFIEAIEELEDVPFEVIDQARDWEYRIETEGFVEQSEGEVPNTRLLNDVKSWVSSLQRRYS